VRHTFWQGLSAPLLYEARRMVCNKRDRILCLLKRKNIQLLIGQEKSFCRRLPSCHHSRIWYTISGVTMGEQLVIDIVSCIETVQLYLCWLNDSDQRPHSIGYLGDEEGMVLDHGTLLSWFAVMTSIAVYRKSSGFPLYFL
jgi:hypothetical protein